MHMAQEQARHLVSHSWAHGLHDAREGVADEARVRRPVVLDEGRRRRSGARAGPARGRGP